MVSHGHNSVSLCHQLLKYKTILGQSYSRIVKASHSRKGIFAQQMQDLHLEVSVWSRTFSSAQNPSQSQNAYTSSSDVIIN